MDNLELKKLFESIKKDDVKSFSSIMISNSDLNISFGRFPLLSICYLYESYNILSKYEKLLMPIHNFKIENEYFEIYRKFKSRAGKIIRLFSGEEKIVCPIEMLAVLDERIKINENYKFLYKNEEIDENIKKIYNLKFNLSINKNDNEFDFPRKKLKFKQKILIAISLLVSLIFVCFSFSSLLIIKNKYGLGTARNPILISNEQELKKAIANGRGYYKLTSDIVLTENFSLNNFNGSIYGDDHTIDLSENDGVSLLNKFSGLIENLNITINLENIKINENSSIIAKKSTGNIKNCVISGVLTAEYESAEDAFWSGFVYENSGILENCSVEMTVTINNNGSTNSYFSNFVGINNDGGKIINCKSTGTVNSNTVDLGGIACINYGKIKSAENSSKLTQVSEKEWHPNVAGVVIENYGEVIESKNLADLNSESTLGESEDIMYVFVGGICCNNYDYIGSCENYGNISASSVVSKIYASGVCSSSQSDNSEPVIEKCFCEADIVAVSENNDVYASGIVSMCSSTIVQDLFLRIFIQELSSVKNCGFSGTISTNSKTAFAGGVVAYNYYSSVENCYSYISITDLSVAETGYIQACGAVISVSWDLSLVKNLHYVKNDDLVAVNSISNYLSGYRIQPLSDDFCSATAYDSFNDIPEEVRL